MKTVFYIALATLLTFASCYSFGVLLLRVLRLRLYRSEERMFAFLAGGAVLSTLVFLLGVAGFARKSVFLWVTIPAIAAVLWKRWGRPAGDALPPLPFAWRAAFWTGFILFTWQYLPQALLPETSPDGVAYHVAVIAKYAREHRIAPTPTSMYAQLSEGAEMLFLYAFSIGKHTAAAMCHFLFLLALPFAIVSYGRRIGRPGAGVAAALLVYASPVVGRTGVIAYVDVAAGVVAFALFYALQIWRDETANWRMLLLAGLLAGFGYAVKYPGAAGIVYLFGFLAWYTLRDPRRLARSAGAAAIGVLAIAGPWLVRNALWYSNPFAPFLNAWFPNPHVYPAFEREYLELFRQMGGVTLARIPVEAAVLGDRLQGVVGPVFLLAPLGLLALRSLAGRQLLLAAVVYLAPYFGNIGSRFLIPALPFIAFSLALGLQRFRGMLPVALAAHLFYSWPTVVPAYAGTYAWRLEPADWNAALRRVPESEYLEGRLMEYRFGQVLDQMVQPGELVFSSALGGRAYHRQEVVIGYESAFGNRIQDMLYRVIHKDLRTTRRYTYAMPPVAARRLRVVQTVADRAPVLIGEIRVFHGGTEVARAPEWRLRASVNPWEVQGAFDNSPLTVWTAGRATEPGMFIQIDFGASVAVDRVTVTVPQSQGWVAMRVEAETGDGAWRVVAEQAELDEAEWPARARSMAAQELKAAGIRWLAVLNEDPMAEDLYDWAEQWGLREAAVVNGIRLWRVE